jgi:predicted Fe-Mo cluster-binding NifX family protein
MSGSGDLAHPKEWREALTETLKRSAVALKRARVPFALGGGTPRTRAAGQASEHDVDFLVREEDAETALAALEQAGLRPRAPDRGLVAQGLRR